MTKADLLVLIGQLDWFDIVTNIGVVIGCILYCYGAAKEPLDTKEFSYRRIFTELLTEPTKKTRKIGTILIYVCAILCMVKGLLEKVI